MKYYLLNRKECRENIYTNPQLIKTKSMSKINKYRKLEKQLNKLKREIFNELRSSNKVITDGMIENFLIDEGTEIVSSEYKAMYLIPLLEDQVQRMRAYNKTAVMSGKLYDVQIR